MSFFPQAVCCADKVHCCPEGTQCDLTHSKCVSSSLQLFPLMQKVPATRRAEHLGEERRSVSEENQTSHQLYVDDAPLIICSLCVSAAPTVVCPDGKRRCPDGATCCQLASGEYGCCMFPQVLLENAESESFTSLSLRYSALV